MISSWHSYTPSSGLASQKTEGKKASPSAEHTKIK